MDSKINKYPSFEVVDLVLNDDFRRLVPEEKNDRSLQLLIRDFPEYKENIGAASKIVLGLQTKKQEHFLQKKYKLWMQIRHGYSREKSFRFYRYAASVLVVVSLGIGALYFVNKAPSVTGFAQAHSCEYNQFRLVLSNGKNIVVQDEKFQVKCTNEGKSVIINDSIRYRQEQDGFNQMIVPHGRQSSVLLSDGTVVRMSSGSRLVYPACFNSNKREVFLEGEAYFEVAKNAGNPFYVHTDAFRVEVVGTTFNVQAYHDENLYNTVLVEGKVNLVLNNHFFTNPVVMRPNQFASLSDDHGHFNIEKIENIENQTSWIHGYLEFKNENLDVLVKRVSLYYNIRIDIINEGKTRINGKLDLKDEPGRILEGIAAIAKMEYKKVGDKNFILYK